jgi:hypothetical protein
MLLKRLSILAFALFLLLGLFSCTHYDQPSTEPSGVVVTEPTAEPSDNTYHQQGDGGNPSASPDGESPEETASDGSGDLASPQAEDETDENQPGYFTADEAQFNGVYVNVTTVDEMKELLGEPDIVETRQEDNSYEVFIYGGVEYQSIEGTGVIHVINIKEFSDADSPRDIKVGDSFDSVMAKFPKEQNPEQSDEGFLFGQSTLTGQGGAIYDDCLPDGTPVRKLIVTSENVDPFMIVYFKDDKVDSIVITIRTT